MADNAARASDNSSLLRLPKELRMEMYDWVVYSSHVEIERVYRLNQAGDNSEDDGDNDSAGYGGIPPGRRHGTRPSTALARLPGTPRDIAALKLTCRQLNQEVPDDWHSKVTYYFPSTVAFLDILSQWPEEKIRSLRYAHVVDTPLPLYPHSYAGAYATAAFHDALPAFPGLQLDALTVENIWLKADGREKDSWCMEAVNGAVQELLLSSGWKHLHYLSGILGLAPSQQRQLHKMIQDCRWAKSEPDFTFGYGHVRPQLNWRFWNREDKHDTDYGDLQEEVKLWYQNHPEEGQPDGYPEVEKLHVALWATRGANVDYTQDGAWTYWGGTLKDLMDNVGWLQVSQDANLGFALLLTRGLGEEER